MILDVAKFSQIIILTHFYSSAGAIVKCANNIEDACEKLDSQSVVENAASIARRGKRVLQVVQQEMENSDELSYQQQLVALSDELQKGVVVLKTYFSQFSN